MAFTTPKYELKFNDIYQPSSGTVDAYRIRIYIDGYTSSTYPIYGTTSPISIETINSDGDSYVPIVATKATLNLYQSPNFNIEDFLNADDSSIMITVENGTSTSNVFTATGVIWRGFFLPSENIQFSVVDLASYSLTFVDGLGKLKQNRLYYNTLNLFGFNAGYKTSVIKYISDALLYTDLPQLDIWVNQFYQTGSVTGRNIEGIYIRNNYFCTEPGTYLTYYDILEQLCRKYGWECYYKDDHWHLESYGCLTRNAAPSYYIYNYAGNYQSTNTTTYPASIQIDNTNNFKQLNRSMLMGLNIPKNSFKFIHRIQNAKNILNAYFQSWTIGSPDAFDTFGTMTYNKLNSSGGILITSYTTNMLDTADYLRSESVKVKAGDILNIAWEDINIGGNENRYKIMLIPDDVTNPSYFIDGTASFTSTDTMLYRFSTYTATWKNQTTVPVDGTISLFIYNPYYNGGGTLPYQELKYFNIAHYGTSSQVNNFDSVQYLSSVLNKFNAQDMTYDIGAYFTNMALISTLNNYLNYNNDDAVMSSVYLGTLVDLNNVHVLDEFGRQTNSTTPLYQLVAEDVGVDMLNTQYTILGDFKSLGYWINRRFNYSLGTSYNYLLKNFKWDLKQAIQSSTLYKINYNPSAPFNPNFGTPTLNLKNK